MNELALFAGAGGGILGGRLLGWRTVCAVELDAYAAAVLAQRQNDGILEAFPIWSDIRSFDGKPWCGIVDVISGGFPCQDISAAGKGAGIEGERSGLWTEMARVIREVRPRYALVENSPILTSRGLGVVLGDLAAMGFDAEWGVFAASDMGAPHERERIWILAHADRQQFDRNRKAWRRRSESSEIPSETMEYASSLGRREGRTESEIRSGRNAAGSTSGEVGNASGERCRETRRFRRDEPTERLGGTSETVGHPDDSGPQRFWELLERAGERTAWQDGEVMVGHDGSVRLIKPGISPLANGLARRVERIRTAGNGQVPIVAALAWTVLFERIQRRR